MTKIKISSNPYLKLIDYYVENGTKGWENINENPDYNGKLKSDKFIHGFFPFIVEDIVEDIIDEYYDDTDAIELYFDGTPDEYENLCKACENQKFDGKIKVNDGDSHLNNAYDILPKIIEIFKRVQPIVEKTEEENASDKDFAANDINKFFDASDEIIPICVIGNYSAGKSTFINSLIGAEILPSGDKAVTARVYKIYQEKQSEKAFISFSYGEKSVELSFVTDQFEISGIDDVYLLTKTLNDNLNKINDKKLVTMVNCALSVINSYKNNDENDIGAIIEIHYPFVKGLWGDFKGSFVILDTPGSNAASHADHKEVLLEAMRGMSNGIPVYVSEYDSLDSTDNVELYDAVREMEGLDSRFTMIVVNKADGSNLPAEGLSEEEQDEILNQSIPKNLYSSGLFFVSSIMGLGSKTNGYFIDDHYDEVFDLNKENYGNDNSRHYKELYKYDIMPDQIKENAIESAEREAETGDRIYVNSGTYSIEEAIHQFAVKYASYNKCQQSKLFLRKVIDLTENNLQAAIEKRENSKKEMEEKLERDKKQMIQDIEQNANSERDSYINHYQIYISKTVENQKKYYSLQDLTKMQESYTEKEKKNFETDTQKKDAIEHANNIGQAFKKGFNAFVERKGIQESMDAGKTITNEIKELIGSGFVIVQNNIDVDKQASSDVIGEVNGEFIQQVKNAEKSIDKAATDYWNNCSQTFRNKLADVVKSTTLSENKKDEITDIIRNYKSLKLDIYKFQLGDFDHLFDIGDFKVMQTNKIILIKLVNTYKNKIIETVNNMASDIQESYQNNFNEWSENIVNIVRAHIVDYSPELKEQQIEIDKETNHINELKTRENKLNMCNKQIDILTDWQSD